MAAVTIHSDFGAHENKTCQGFHFFPINMLWSDGTGCHNFSFLNVEFQASFFTFIKRLFSFSLLSAIRVISSTYLRLLAFLPAILIPACDSSSPAFPVMCSEHKLNKQGDSILPCLILFPILNQSFVHVKFSCFLTCIQVSQETGTMVWNYQDSQKPCVGTAKPCVGPFCMPGHVPLSDCSPVSLLWVVAAQDVEWGSEVEREGTSLSQ